ncbi:MAG: hypothetical protein WAS73_02285 [Defluviicoccus sp.]
MSKRATGRATHEDITAHTEIKGGSDRGFGLTVGGILAAIGLVRGALGAGLDVWTVGLVGVGSVLVGLALVAAGTLAPLNRAWTILGLVLFRVVNPVVLFLIFVITVVPTGLIMRGLGRDLLRLRRDPAVSSYWIERQPPGPDPEGLRNQF